MATFHRFEDIQAWQKARLATKTVYWVTDQGDFARDFGLRDQIRRSAISIMANIAEGHGRRSDAEFANFLNITRASVAETQSHLYVALDLNYINKDDFDQIYEMLSEVSRMIMSLIKHLRF